MLGGAMSWEGASHNHRTHKLQLWLCTTLNQQGQSTFPPAVRSRLSCSLTKKGEDVKRDRGRLRASPGVGERVWRVLGGVERGTWGYLRSRCIVRMYEDVKDKQRIFYQRDFTIWMWKGRCLAELNEREEGGKETMKFKNKVVSGLRTCIMSCTWTHTHGNMHAYHANAHEERNEVAEVNGWLLSPGGRRLLRQLRKK